MLRALRIGSSLALFAAVVSNLAIFDLMVGELFTAWGIHMFVVCLVLMLLALRQGSRRDAGAFFLAGYVFAWPFVLSAKTGLAMPHSTGETMTVAVANTFYDNEHWPEIAEQLDEGQLAMSLLVEPPPELVAWFDKQPGWTVAASHLPGGKYNIALVVRNDGPLHGLKAVVRPGQLPQSAWIEGWTRFKDRPVRVLGYHVPAPTRPDQHEERLRQLSYLEDAARSSTTALVAFGDFNLPESSPRYRALLKAGLGRADAWGFGSWPAPVAQLGLRLDYVWVKDLSAVEEELVSLPGSDHRAVITKLGTIGL